MRQCVLLNSILNLYLLSRTEFRKIKKTFNTLIGILNQTYHIYDIVLSSCSHGSHPQCFSVHSRMTILSILLWEWGCNNTESLRIDFQLTCWRVSRSMHAKTLFLQISKKEVGTLQSLLKTKLFVPTLATCHTFQCKSNTVDPVDLFLPSYSFFLYLLFNVVHVLDIAELLLAGREGNINHQPIYEIVEFQRLRKLCHVFDNIRKLIDS